MGGSEWRGEDDVSIVCVCVRVIRETGECGTFDRVYVCGCDGRWRLRDGETR
jgi:hypothetical protein